MGENRLRYDYPSADFPQRLHIGDYAVLLGQSGPTAGKSGGSQGLVQITGVEAFESLDQRGVIFFWSNSGAPPAGFGTIDTNGVTSTIAAAGSVTSNGGLAKLQFKSSQLAQIRFRLAWATAPTGGIHNYDVQLLNPVSTQRGAFARVNAVMNAMFQMGNPLDTIISPAQDANGTIQAASTAYSRWQLAARTEQWLLEDNSVGVKVINNGSVVTATGNLGFECSGYVYNFDPIDPTDGQRVHLMKRVDLVLPPGLDPNDIVPVQIGARDPW